MAVRFPSPGEVPLIVCKLYAHKAVVATLAGNLDNFIAFAHCCSCCRGSTCWGRARSSQARSGPPIPIDSRQKTSFPWTQNRTLSTSAGWLRYVSMRNTPLSATSARACFENCRCAYCHTAQDQARLHLCMSSAQNADLVQWHAGRAACRTWTRVCFGQGRCAPHEVICFATIASIDACWPTLHQQCMRQRAKSWKFISLSRFQTACTSE
jgi:hypothetical protein